jgi:hypothetical protein
MMKIRFLTAVVVTGCMLAQPAMSQNLVTNGDFESGNTGFTSQYSFNPNPTAGFYNGEYTIASSSATAFPQGFQSTQFNALGSLALFADGATNNAVVYSTTVLGLTPFQSYTFSFEAANASANPAEAAVLQVLNGAVPLTAFTAPIGAYGMFSTTIVATGTTATISIRDLNTSSAGNDFSIDNVSLVDPRAVAVPGPVAGAGLVPLLGLAGAWYARRRKHRAA